MRRVSRNGKSSFVSSFPVRNRAARFIWNIIYATLYRPSPRVCFLWRVFLLRCFGARIGRACRIYPRSRIWAPWNLTCGDYAMIADDVIIYNQAPITIEEACVISQGAHLCTGTHNYSDPGFKLIARPIKIERHAWICAEAFILPDITVGEHSVVGARSVVTRNVPPHMVCAGNPCRPIKKKTA